MDTDILVLGSGLSALSFAALMARRGHKVTILEAHELAGGYGHTFVEKNTKHEYHFNAQLHYVWDCGEGDPVHQVLKKLSLDQTVKFIQLDPDGFDHMNIPSFKLRIPANYEQLIERLAVVFPRDHQAITQFLKTTQRVATLIRTYRKSLRTSWLQHLINNRLAPQLLFYRHATLQSVFDAFRLPLAAQSLLASQWVDFMLPPEKLSFFCWCVLFDGYMRGPSYPEQHFEHVINSLVNSIRANHGQVIFNQTVTQMIVERGRIARVVAQDTLNPANMTTYSGKTVICNMDPKVAAQMIGLEHFSPRIKKKLAYDYSASNFMVYGAVEGIDLREYGFGNWNVFHSEEMDLNQTFHRMYDLGDYSKPSFAITTPSLVSTDPTGCPQGQQLFELLTVANYSQFRYLKYRNGKNYLGHKKHILQQMLRVIEEKYVPHFSDHIVFKMLGSPTTNASYCWSPAGNSYGAEMTPRNMQPTKLSHSTSLRDFYFCNASSGAAGFARAFQNGANLYELLTGDPVI